MKINDLLIEIEQIMNSYYGEIKYLKDTFDKTESNIKKDIADITKKGIDKEISQNYLELAKIFQNIIDDLMNVQKEFPFESFLSNAQKKIASKKPRVNLNLKKNTEDWAQKIQDETLDAMNQINSNNKLDIETLNKYLDVIFQAYVDSQYIKDNIIKLLKDSQVYQREMNKIISTYEDKLTAEKEKYNEISKFENLDSYYKIQQIKEELHDIRSREKEFRLHNGEIEFGNGYNVSFLMGLHRNSPQKKEVVDFSKKFLNDDLHGFDEEKLYWELDKKQGSLIIDLPTYIMSDRSASKFFEYFEQLLFTLFRRIPVRKLQIASIDCPASNNQSLASPFVPILQRAEKYLGSNIIYMPTVRDKSKISQVIDALFLEGQNRSDTYFSEGYGDIFNYNKATPDNQHDFKFLIINNYPFGFSDQEIVAKLKSLIKDKDTGIVPIIFQASEKSVYETSKNSYSNEPEYTYLDPKELGAVYVNNFDFERKTFTFNNKDASFALTVPNFNNLKYWENINQGYKSATILYLESFLNQVEKASDAEKYSIYDYKLRIPIGKINGDTYDFTINTKNDSSAIILGTTGSGKSSLMHTLIFAAAKTYSPKELNICLVDFKGVDASTEFSQYKKGEDLYLPHINYLSLKSTTENALDMLDMLENLQNDRMKIIAKSKVANIVEYNNLPGIKNTTKIMPRILFIIDEFNTMLQGGASKGDDSSINDVIEERIFSLLTRVRSSGITIIFSGHSTAGLNERSMSQIKIRIGLNGFVGRLFEEKYNEMDFDAGNILSEKGKALISTDLGKSKSVVSLAFSGETGSEMQLSLADTIRKKYASLGNNFEQVIAGSTEIMPISEVKNLKDIILEEAQLDKDSYSSYIGVTSTSSLPVAMRFSSEQSALNYIMSGESNRLAIYERNVILGFMYMLKVRKLLSDKENVSYIRIESGIKDKLNALLDYVNYDLINKHVVIKDSEIEACKEILKVHSIFQNRNKKANKDTTPYLLVVHNVSWLKETSWKDDDTSFELKKEEETESASDLNNASADDIIAMFTGGNDNLLKNPKTNVEPIDINDDVDPYKAMQALMELYCKGYRQNIFVVLSSPIYADLNDYITATERDNTANHFAISDGFNIRNDTNKYPASCCHVNSTKIVANETTIETKFISSKTRLFDYSLKSESDFLKVFEEEY